MPERFELSLQTGCEEVRERRICYRVVVLPVERIQTCRHWSHVLCLGWMSIVHEVVEIAWSSCRDRGSSGDVEEVDH